MGELLATDGSSRVGDEGIPVKKVDLGSVEGAEDVLLLCVPFDNDSTSKFGGNSSSCNDKQSCAGGVGTGEVVLVNDREGLPLVVKLSPLLADSRGETGTRGGLGAPG